MTMTEKIPGDGPEATLEALRARLDGIDGQLLDVVRQRLDCCGAIGHYKKRHAIPMMQPHRIGIVQLRAEDFAMKHGLSAKFFRTLYELIIEETCRLEDEIIAAPAGESGGL